MSLTMMNTTVLKTMAMTRSRMILSPMLMLTLNTMALFGQRNSCPLLEMEGVSCWRLSVLGRCGFSDRENMCLVDIAKDIP